MRLGPYKDEGTKRLEVDVIDVCSVCCVAVLPIFSLRDWIGCP